MEKYTKNLFKRTEEELVDDHVKKNNSEGRGDISLEMNRRLVKELRDFNKSSSKQTKEMLNLNRMIIWLTYIMTLFAMVQLFIIQKDEVYRWITIIIGGLFLYGTWKFIKKMEKPEGNKKV